MRLSSAAITFSALLRLLGFSINYTRVSHTTELLFSLSLMVLLLSFIYISTVKAISVLYINCNFVSIIHNKRFSFIHNDYYQGIKHICEYHC